MAKKKKKKVEEFMMHTRTGRICPRTDLLEERGDFVDCDKDGKRIGGGKAIVPTDDLTLEEKVDAIRTKQDLITLGAQHDIGFEPKMTLKAMKAGFLAQMAEAAEDDEDEGDDDKE